VSDSLDRGAASGRPGTGPARQLGFVGLGAMGNPMAANLLAAGHALMVTDIREEAAANLIEAGATWAATPAEAARDRDVVFLSLPNPSDVEEVVTRSDGVLAGAAPGSVIVDLSTNEPGVARSLAVAAAEQGVHFLDAPVSGGVEGARRGRLAVMVGGDPGQVEAVRPLLEVIGDRIFPVGPVGSGNVVKLLNNMMFFVNLLGSLEALVVGAKAGIDPEVLREVVKAGSGGSSVWEFATRAVLADKLAPRFTVALASKDIGLATALADEVGVDVAMGQMARRLIHQYRDADHGGEDVFGLVRMIEEQAGVIVRGTGTSTPGGR
jgi:3-hydroxyisobutyrate dehydrogenase-like beta-hydroxyacid dehydrogenase